MLAGSLFPVHFVQVLLFIGGVLVVGDHLGARRLEGGDALLRQGVPRHVEHFEVLQVGAGGQATLPSYLDDEGRHVVFLGALGPLANLVKEGGNDCARCLVAVCPDHLERATNAEARASA
jgi:hypothetical protein